MNVYPQNTRTKAGSCLFYLFAYFAWFAVKVLFKDESYKIVGACFEVYRELPRTRSCIGTLNRSAPVLGRGNVQSFEPLGAFGGRRRFHIAAAGDGRAPMRFMERGRRRCVTVTFRPRRLEKKNGPALHTV
jgi:hypothetical protein